MKFTIRKACNCSFFLTLPSAKCVSLLSSGRKGLIFRARKFLDALIKLLSGCVTLSIKILRQVTFATLKVSLRQPWVPSWQLATPGWTSGVSLSILWDIHRLKMMGRMGKSSTENPFLSPLWRPTSSSLLSVPSELGLTFIHQTDGCFSVYSPSPSHLCTLRVLPIWLSTFFLSPDFLASLCSQTCVCHLSPVANAHLI